MSANPSKVFAPVTAQQWGKIAASLEANGMPIPANEGVLKHSGATVEYAFIEPNLSITVVGSPFIVSKQKVLDLISEHITPYLSN